MPETMIVPGILFIGNWQPSWIWANLNFQL